MSLPAKIPARRPRICHLDGDMVRFSGCACLPVRGVVWCRSHANLVQNRFKKSSFSSVRLLDRVGCQFIQFSFGHWGQVPPFSSFSSLHKFFWPWFGLNLRPHWAGEIMSPIPNFLDSSTIEADIDAKFSEPYPASILRLSLISQEI